MENKETKIKSLLEYYIINDLIKNKTGLFNDTIQLDFIYISDYIQELINDNKKKDIELFELQEKLDYKTKELKEYENILCFHSSDSDDEDDSLKDLNSLKEKENEKEYENILNNCSEEIREEYNEDIERENDIIEMALEINQLQFEIHEHFCKIKEYILKDDNREEKYEKYKNFKRDFLKIIDTTYKYIDEEYKRKYFDELFDIIEKQSILYELDENIKG
jgi:hypothetical protein